MQTNPLDHVLSDELKMPDADREAISGLQQKIRQSGCTGCSLHEDRGKFSPVPGEGRGRIMFVGHRIGRQEAYQTRPAIGQNSQYGFQILMDALPVDNTGMPDSMARNHILDYGYVTNAARCAHEEDPSTAHWKRCAGSRGPNWLNMEMSFVDPEIVVFWNKQAARSVLQEEPPTRGEIEHREIYGTTRPVMRMTHPVKVYHQPDEEVTVRADYQKLIRWLWENEYMQRDPQLNTAGGADHKLITTAGGLQEMTENLSDKQVIALDTETFLNADVEHLEAHLRDAHEAEKTALLWWHENFEMVCYQIAGQAPDGGVDTTYTVAMRFRDEVTGEPYQRIRPEEATDALDHILSSPPADTGYRDVYTWNALFDCPVLTRENVDTWGILPKPYPIRIWDGQIIMGRMHEHMGGKAGRTSLDNAARVYLHEGKPAFDEKFDPDTFAYTDITDSEMREHLLEYTGEDPRKTLLVVNELFGELRSHVDERSKHTRDQPSNMPSMGFRPFPKPNNFFTGSRLQDTAIPLDHQMIPMIGEMEMLGFKYDTTSVDEAEKYTEWAKRNLLELIQEREPGYNPNSSDHALNVLHDVFRTVAEEINRIAGAADDPNALDRLAHQFQIDSQWYTDQIETDHVIQAFNDVYGELNAQKDTINTKFLIYYQTSLELLRAEAEELGHEVDVGPENDPDRLEKFFDRVFLFKQIDKKFGTYFERFAEITDRNDTIHPFYLIISTLSGRFSGNFQNVPRGGEEDIEMILDLFEAIGLPIPEDEDEKQQKINEYNRFDVRQACYPLQADDLNRQFEKMDLPWEVRTDDEYVIIGADYAGQEDRMAFAESGDETKARLLSNPDLDTHFYNVAFCFGDQLGYDTSTEEGIMQAYEHVTKTKAIDRRETVIRKLVNEQNVVMDDSGVYIGDEFEDLQGTPADEAIDELRSQIYELRKKKKEYKSKYRTPMKTVHYASQYGAGVQKLHMVLKPIFLSIGEEWTPEDTKDLKGKYDELYAGVTEAREELINGLEQVPYLEYPVWGALRHANVDPDGEVQDALSAANAYNQGACAYMTKMAMLRMRHLIYKNAERWGLVHAGGDRYVGVNLQVHDEIAVLAPKCLAKEVALALESAMKMILKPHEGEDGAFYDRQKEDARHDTGWLAIPDEDIVGETLFDADAEIKKTVAKAKTLANGDDNLLALLDEPETIKRFHEEHPLEVNEEHELTLARAGYTNTII